MNVIKRDGSIVTYNIFKIYKVIEKAFSETNHNGAEDIDYLEMLTEKIDKELNSNEYTVEEIQDVVEKILMLHEPKVAKAFILYREERRKNRIPHIRQNPGYYMIEYPEVIKLAEWQQNTLFWRPEEIRVYKDLQDLRTNLTESQLYSFISYLKLFTEYELRIGRDFWIGKFIDIFPRPEFAMFGTVIANTEQFTHARFYNMANEVLGLNTPDFLSSWKNDPELKQRIDFIDEMLDNDDPLVVLAAMVFSEGMILYSPFAYFKSYQENGFNLVANFASGIEFSLREESFHCECTVRFFKELLTQSNLNKQENLKLKETVLEIHKRALEHEIIITRKAFLKGVMDNISEEELLSFVYDRGNKCLAMLGYGEETDTSPINKWFYKSLVGYIKGDQFVSVSREYTSDSCPADYEINEGE